MSESHTYTTFAGNLLVVSGDLETMLLRTKERLDAGEAEPVLIFDDQTGRQIDFDFRGTPDEVLARVSSHPLFATPEEALPSRKGPGRPYLGVVGGEVSLLPRHWDWLNQQRGGASATLRRLVDEERKRTATQERFRNAWEAAGKFMWVMAGNLPNFEEASRALYTHDTECLTSLTQDWPTDVRNHLLRFVRMALDAS